MSQIRSILEDRLKRYNGDKEEWRHFRVGMIGPDAAGPASG
jgi:hypothetical protein